MKEQIEQELQALYETFEQYEKNEGLDNYSHLPMESNYYDHTVYSNTTDILDHLRITYGYHSDEDLLHDLYTHCDIISKWNSGYFYLPVETISFGYYRVEEVEHEIPEYIAEQVLSLTEEEQENISTDFCLDIGEVQVLGYMYLCGGVSFELSIAEAIDYLESVK